MDNRIYKKIRRYFNSRDYIILYIDSFFSNFANSIYQVFTPIILYQAGISISLIFFIYAIQFFLMGVLTPLSGYLSKKYGVVFTKLLGYLLKFISLWLVLSIDINTIYYLFIPIIYGISGAINNPLKTYLPSKIVKENFRGRFNAFVYILNCISSVIAYVFSAIYIFQNKHMMILGVVFICYFISLFALFFLTKSKFYYRFKHSFYESYQYLFSSNENKSFKRISGLRSFIIIERLIAVLLYLYICLNDLKTFTVVYIVSTLLELISLIISGRRLDRNRNTFYTISSIKGIISFIFVIVKEKIILLFNQSLYKLSDHVYDSLYSALLQSKVENDHKNTFVLSMVHEMSLCFYEFVVLIILSMVSMIDSIVTFKLIFICSILVIISSNGIVKNWEVK